MSFRAKDLNLQDVSSRIHEYEMNNRNVGTQHDFLDNFVQRVKVNILKKDTFIQVTSSKIVVMLRALGDFVVTGF